MWQETEADVIINADGHCLKDYSHRAELERENQNSRHNKLMKKDIFTQIRQSKLHLKLFLFYREGHTIHLVVFVERTSGFWWHGDMTAPQGWVGDAVPTNMTNLKFGTHAGAFEKWVYLQRAT